MNGMLCTSTVLSFLLIYSPTISKSLNGGKVNQFYKQLTGQWNMEIKLFSGLAWSQHWV